MGRHLAESCLTEGPAHTSGIQFALASAGDEADVRRLLRENEMDGWVRLTLEREPNAFAAGHSLGRPQSFIIARDHATRAAASIGEVSIDRLFVDGAETSLPYFGALRTARRYRNRIDILKGGFNAARRVMELQDQAPLALTAIASDNHRALRVLRANLPGMPVYRFIGRMVTLAVDPRRRMAAGVTGMEAEPATATDLPAIATCLQKAYRDQQYAPVWTTASLEHLCTHAGLRPQHFRILRQGAGVAGCIAAWDQGAFRQTVIKGYAPWLARLRPALNMLSPLTRWPKLPAPGKPLREVFLSHFAVVPGCREAAATLIDAALAQARTRGFAVALLGLAADNPLLPPLQRALRPRVYESERYLVGWDRTAGEPAQIERQAGHTEIALL